MDSNLSDLQYLPWLVGGVLLLATIFFFRQFFFPSRHLYKELDAAIQKVGEIKQRLNGAPIVDLDEIQAVMVTEELKHLWSEYAETLHPQKKPDESRQLKIIRYRATAMAEVFFSEQALVETPLKTAFYKHLPGILTGLGIIGTFSGLIYGLNEFQVTDDPNAVKASLGTLIRGVGHAFIISAIAIGLAMLCIWWTNRELTLRYRQVEQLCQLIDNFFDAGAGEEYLARLVEASETSATQATQLKDALVGWEAVRDVVAGAAAYEARHRGVNFKKIAVTNQRFNSVAREQARLTGVDLVDCDGFAEMLIKHPVSRDFLS